MDEAALLQNMVTYNPTLTECFSDPVHLSLYFHSLTVTIL